MVKLAKYLKPFAAAICLSVLLLFGQAMCDLNLPNLMSDLVDVGIQQGGIESAAPEAMSRQGMELLSLGLSPQEEEIWKGAYQEVLPESEQAKTLVEQYPLLNTEPIYLKKDLTREQEETAELLAGRAAYALMQAKQQASGLQSQEVNSVSELLQAVEKLPEQQLEEIRLSCENVPESTLRQTGISLSKLLYQDLGTDVAQIQSSYMVNKGLQMLLVALLGGLATVSVSFLAARIGAGLARNLRRDIFEKVESFSSSEFDHFSTASLITRTTNDVTQIQMLATMGLRMLCYAPIMGIGGVIMALNTSVSMSWVIGLAVLLLITMAAVIFKIAMPKFKTMQKLIDKMNLVARENLSGLMVIRAFGTENFEKDRFDATNRNLAGTQRFVNRVMIFMLPAMMLIMNCSSLLVVWVGSEQIARSALQVGDMMAFIQYAMHVIMSFLFISMMFIMVPRASVSAERI